jgi:hypothetical protein
MTKIKHVENFWKRRLLQQSEKPQKSIIVDKLRAEMVRNTVNPNKVAEVAWMESDQ